MPDKLILGLAVFLLAFTCQGLKASESVPSPLRVAVAANFSSSLMKLARDYEGRTGQGFTVSTGSTGKLYAQIVQGAPYDVFFAADAARPALLEAAGLTAGAPVTYVQGRLILWRRDGNKPVSLEDLARAGGRIAIANPRLAPYGEAAKTLLEKASLWELVSDRLVLAENVVQTFQYARTGQTDWAFLAMPQVRQSARLTGELLEISQEMHEPIRQQVVVLKNGSESQAKAFLDFCLGQQAAEYLLTAGYALPGEP